MPKKCRLRKWICWKLRQGCLTHPLNCLPRIKGYPTAVFTEEIRLITGQPMLVKVCPPYYDKNLRFDFSPEIKSGGVGRKQFLRERWAKRRRGGCDIEGCLCGKEYSSVKARHGHQIARRLMELVGRNIRGGSGVGDNWSALLGCSVEQLKSYIAKQFEPEMLWSNWGDWHLDHIRPLSSFDLDDNKELEKACHYTNLQPLWAFDNLSKGAKWTG